MGKGASLLRCAMPARIALFLVGILRFARPMGLDVRDRLNAATLTPGYAIAGSPHRADITADRLDFEGGQHATSHLTIGLASRKENR
jgi:hypothetical protein